MGKGGGGGHTPYEAPESGRSKQQVKIVEIISEGEIEGLVDGVKSVYLDNTPIQASDDSYNFSNVEAQGRVGSQDQDILEGFNTSEKEISVATQVRKTTPITRTITDSKVSRLRLTLGVQSLFSQNDQGDTNTASVNLIVTIGSQQYPVTISGKYSSQYLRQLEFGNLPKVPFTVKVERTTADSKSQRLQNNTLWSSYTEIIETQFAYPNTALVGIKFDSEYFNSIPNRTYEIYGIKVQVPSNYDPKTRKYSGLWDGTFKVAWTDNPAWVLMDVLTNKRYGLGQRLGEFNVDKWTLYQVAQYCDQLVPDGFGGKEPRFTCNAWLTEQRSAYDVINDLCSIFRAMPVWNGRAFTVVMDRPSDPVWTYTNANVIDGEFTYQYSAMKSRHNAIQVEYSDAENNYEKAIEYVSDDDLIRRYGLNLKKVTAFGCTSRGQAHRTGLWLLQTEKLETKTVTFSVGMEGLMHIPGDIIQVADSHFAGTEIGGRVLGVNEKTVTLDREIQFSKNSYFSYIDNNAQVANIKINAVSGKVVTLDSIPTGLEQYGVWSLTTEQVALQLFRALSVTEEEKGKYTITALQHEPQKEAIVDNGAHFEPKATRIKTPTVNAIQIEVNGNQVSLNADVSGGDDVVKYDIRIYKAGKLYSVKLSQNQPLLELNDLPDGEYTAVIVAKNAKGQVLSEKTQTFTIDRPPVPTGVKVTGGLGNITLEWDWVNEVTQTEIFASETDNLKSAVKIAQVSARTFTHEVGAKQVRYYWLRHRRGNNLGAFYRETGVRGESSVDVDAELALLNEKLSKNIINEVFDTALPARNLELTKTVKSIDDPTKYLGTKQVYNEKDGALYIWNGKQYSLNKVDLVASEIKGIISANQIADIPSSKISTQIESEKIKSISSNKITGTLSADQIASIPTTKLSGQLTDAQIKQVNASKLIGTISVDRISHIPLSKVSGLEKALADVTIDSISAEKITGTIADSQIKAISASKIGGKLAINNIPNIPTTLLTGNITDSQLQSVSASKVSGTLNITAIPSIPTNKLTGNILDAQIQAVSANKISGTLDISKVPNIPTNKLSGTVSAHQISANAIGANHIGANAITAEKIAAGAVNADKIASNSIESSKIKANAIGTNHLGANIITSEKIAAGAIDARTIKANSIGAMHLQANSVGAEQIKAKSVTASKVVMYGENMIQDPMFLDKAYWKDSMIDAGTVINGVLKVTIRNVQSASDGSYVYGLRNRYNMPIDRDRSYRLQAHIKVTGDSLGECRTYIQLCRYTSLPGTDSLDGVGYSDFPVEINKLGNRNDLVSVVVPSSFFADSKYQSMGIYLRIGTKDNGGKITNAVVEFSQVELIKMADSELIVDGAIISQKIAANAVTADKILANTITGNKIASNTIESNNIKSLAITGDKIHGNAITADKIASNAVTTDKIKAGAITANEIASNSITSAKIVGGSITADKLGANSVTAEKIASNSISATKIQANSIGTNLIQSQAITGEKLAVNSVSADKIQSNSIDSTKIKANSIGANLIQANAITADKLATNSITSAKISTGAIRAEHLASASISTDKLAVGLGGNLLINPIFANLDTDKLPNGCSKWGNSSAVNFRFESGQISGQWAMQAYLPNENMVKMVCDGGDNTAVTMAMTDVPVNEGSYYMASAYMGVHRGTGKIEARVYKSDGSYVGFSSESITGNTFSGGLAGNTKRGFVKFKVPTDGVYMKLIFWLNAVDNENNKILFIARPMLEECTEYTIEPSPWQNAGVTSIHGGSIITRTITTEQLAANSITANEIAAGAIATRHIATNSINANHIVSRSITTDKLNVGSLSAISANLGKVTAGEININNRFKVSAVGAVEMRSNTANVGMVMTSETLIVYDEKGNVRVKLGKLS